MMKPITKMSMKLTAQMVNYNFDTFLFILFPYILNIILCTDEILLIKSQ